MTQSLEDYLEAIYLIIEENKVARVKEVSEKLDVKKPSVNNAIKELEKRNLIKHEKYGYIELTSDGIKKAKNIIRKHNLLKKFLIEILGVNPEIAEKDACQMEHFISSETLNKIEAFVKKNSDSNAKR